MHTECYKDFIGIRSCKDLKPRSGLYIDDLEGVSIPNIAEITTDQPNAEQFLRDKIAFAVRDYGQMVMSFLEQKAAVCFDSCDYSDEYLEASLDQVGVKIERSTGGLSRLMLRGIKVKSKSAGNIAITVTDGQNSETRNFVLAGGEQVLDFDFEPIGSQVTIFADNATELAELECYSNIGCGNCSTDTDFRVTGYFNGADSKSAFGFIPNLCLECDQEKAICNILFQIKQGALYAAGAAVLNEWQASDRLGYLALHSQDWVTHKLEEWTAKAEHYHLSNQLSIERFIQNIDPHCYECNRTTIGYIKP